MMEFDFNELVTYADGGNRLIDHLEKAKGEVAVIMERIKKGGEFLGWVDLPAGEETAVRISRYVSSLPANIDHAVVMGIGGSSLGPKALYSGAYHPMHLVEGWRPKGRRLMFLDNSDPETISSVLGALDFTKTLFVVITKSGSTAETAAQMMIAWEMAARQLGRKAKEHFVFVTDPVKGDLRALAKAHDVAAFPVPPDVGGRFSVLCPVGLLPAALAGIDPLEIVRGARSVMPRCLGPDLTRNPAALLGAAAFLLDGKFGRNIHVLMSYADRLADTGAWFRQLWAESLGKRKNAHAVGPTPLDARGAADQHSLLQLLKEGPGDKFVIFVDVRGRRRLEIPSIFKDYDSFSYLGGRGVEELISFERRGTQRSLALASVPTMTIDLEEVSVPSIAALMYLLEVATAVAGFMYGVNPFSQPGVEESKKFSQALMGRPGCEKHREEYERGVGDRDEGWVIKI